MQRVKELTAIQVAGRLKVHSETVKRWYREGKLKGEIKEGRLYIKENDLRDFLLKRKDTPEKFLQLFDPFKEFKEKIINPVENFFGDEPGCVIALPPGGIPYALSLYFSLPPAKDINFISLGEKQLYEPALIEDRKILIVDDATRTGESVKTIKEKLMKINIREIKIAVYDDFAGCADFAVRRQDYNDHLNFLKQALE
jgi:hypothetical protein